MKVFCSKFNILLNTSFSFHLIDKFFEIFLSDFHNYIRVHLDESSVAVPCPTSIAGFFSKYVNNVFI